MKVLGHIGWKINRGAMKGGSENTWPYKVEVQMHGL